MARYKHFDLLRASWQSNESFLAIDCQVSEDSLLAGCIVLNGMFCDSILVSDESRTSFFRLLVPDDLVSPRIKIKMVKINSLFKFI